MQTYCGLDLADIWRGALHPRRVWQLVECLPSDSALHAVMSGGIHFRDWNLQAQLAASLLNVVRIADVNNIRVNGGKSKDPKPIEVPVPGTPKNKPKLNLASHPMAQKITP